MKKARVLILLTLLLCFATLLGSCNSQPKEWKASRVFGKVSAEPAPERLTKATQLSVSGEFLNANGSLILFHKNGDPDEYTVYNFKTDRVIGTFTESSSIDQNVDYTVTLYQTNQYSVDFFRAVKETTDANLNITYKTTLYDAEGNVIAEADSALAPESAADLIRFDNTYYRVSKKGKISKAFEQTEMADNMPAIFAASKKYYYADPDNANGVVVLDQKLRPVSSLLLPSYAESVFKMILANGKVLFQYRVLLPDQTQEYDLYAGASKYNVVTLLFDAKKGTSKEIKSNYLLLGGLTLSENILLDGIPAQIREEMRNTLDSRIDNFCPGYQVQDRRISNNITDQLFLSVNNSGKVDGILNRFVSGMTDFETVAEGTLRLTDSLGRSFLYTKNGKLIGDVTGAIGYNENYIVGAQKIYDFKLKEVFDYAAEKYEFVDQFDNGLWSDDLKLKAGLIFSKLSSGNELEYYLFANGKMTKICKAADFLYNFDTTYYVVRNENSSYTYFNDVGESLVTIEKEGSIRVAATTKYAAALLETTDQNGNKIYYKLSAK